MNDRSALHRRLPRAPGPLLLGLCLAFGAAPAGAGEWAQCGPLALPEAPASLPDALSGDPESVHIESDDADLSQEGTSSLSGNVHLQSGSRHLRAERLVYDHESEEARAEGDVRLWDEGVFVGADRVEIALAQERAFAERARFILRDAHAHGSAARVSLEGPRLVRVEDGRYTTCNPGEETWVLEAGAIDIDREKQVGTARSVWLRVHGAPVFYAPFLSFPLSDARSSGFLPPTAGVSDSNGLELGASYYFNLAPNRDATLGLRWLNERGVQTAGEYRYLMPWGSGRVSGEYMPEDREYGDERAALAIRHDGAFASRWSADIDYQWASDDDYLRDFGADLAHSALAHLPQRADLIYSGSWFRVRGRMQDYQMLDGDIAPEDLPYARLPQLLATTRLPERNRRINFAGAAELAHFDRDFGVTGTRMDLQSSLYFPVRGPSGFVVPKLGLRLTHYDLSDVHSGAEDSPSRLLPTFSIDSGLHYERDLALASGSFVQTLEPRAFYLLVPSRNQDDQPLFDTGYASDDFAQLFRENRFNGADRIGDANQLTLGLRSRLLSSSRGEEIASASIGQIYYFRDRSVTLPGAAREDESVSDIIAEGALRMRHPWSLRSALHWDPDEGRASRASALLRYQPGARRVINAAYRFLREDPQREHEELEQVDLSFAWPVAREWRAVARWTRALHGGRNLESMAGLEYDGCCLTVRTAVRRYLNGGSGDYTNAVFLNFELKGLGGAGSPEAGPALRGISGY